jgi:tetratricopeptide (TPR) repeat protein
VDRESVPSQLARSLSRAEQRVGDSSGAARALERYLAREAHAREARIELVRLLEGMARLEDALSTATPLLEAGAGSSGNPSRDTGADSSGNPMREAGAGSSGNPMREPGNQLPEDQALVASLLVRAEKHALAIPLLMAALARRPDNLELKGFLERAESGLREQEIARLGAALAAGTASEDDRWRLAGLHLLKTLPGTPTGDADPIFLRFAAEHWTRRGRIDRAEAALRKLCTTLAYAPGSEQEKAMLYRVAALYERAGDRSKARRAYLELMARDPSFRDVGPRLESHEEQGVAGDTRAAGLAALAEILDSTGTRDMKNLLEGLSTVNLALDPGVLATARGGGRAPSP